MTKSRWVSVVLCLLLREPQEALGMFLQLQMTTMDAKHANFYNSTSRSEPRGEDGPAPAGVCAETPPCPELPARRRELLSQDDLKPIISSIFQHFTSADL